MSPIGFYGTSPHVLTNKKVDNKAACLKDIAKADLKITGKTCLALGATAGAAGVATAASKTIQNGLHYAKATVGEILSNIPMGEFEGKAVSLKDAIKDIPVFKKLNSLPTPVKAAIAAGAAALAIIAPYVGVHTVTKNAAIEGKHEVK